MKYHDINRVIRRPEVKHLTGLSDSVLEREVRAGRFPPPFKLSPDPKARAVGWSLHSVQEWIANRESEGVAA